MKETKKFRRSDGTEVEHMNAICIDCVKSDVCIMLEHTSTLSHVDACSNRILKTELKPIELPSHSCPLFISARIFRGNGNPNNDY